MNTEPEVRAPEPFNDIPDPVSSSVTSVPPPRSVSLPEAPRRSLVFRHRVTALTVSVAWLGSHLAVYGVRQDLSELSAAYVIAQVLVPLAFAACSLFLALEPGKLGLGTGIVLAASLLIAGPAAFWLIAFGVPPPRPAASGSGSMLSIALCLDLTLAWAAVPLLAAALSVRRAFPALARIRAALLGAAAGLFSGAVMNLHCPNVDRAHIALGHGVVILVAVVLGAVVVARTART